MSRITEEDINIMNKGTTELCSINGEEYEEGEKGKCYRCNKIFDRDIAEEIDNGDIIECPNCGRIFQ